jgi:WD40 repeat protein
VGKNGTIAAVASRYADSVVRDADYESGAGRFRFESVIDVVTPAGTLRPLFAAPGVEEIIFSPSFSCDGRRLIYGGNNGGPSFIEVADARTGEKLPRHAPGEGWGFPQFPFPLARSFDAHGTFYLRDGRILFTRSRAEGHAPPGTFVVGGDGSGLRRLFGHPVVAGTGDGRWFIGGTPGTASGVRLLDFEGRTVPWSMLSLDAAADPCFSPDGRRVAYSKEGDLYVVRRDGSHWRRLTRNGESQYPVFSPDGRWIAFVRAENVISAVSVAQPEKVWTLARLQNVAGHLGELAWAPRRAR